MPGRRGGGGSLSSHFPSSVGIHPQEKSTRPPCDSGNPTVYILTLQLQLIEFTSIGVGSSCREDGPSVEVLRVHPEDRSEKGLRCSRRIRVGRGERHARGLRLHVLRERAQLQGGEVVVDTCIHEVSIL